MDSLDYWRMCDDLSVIQCILLILGYDPRRLEDDVENQLYRRPQGYEAVSAAVKVAIQRGNLPAHVCMEGWEHGWAEELSEETALAEDQRGRRILYYPEPDWRKTTVSVDDLKTWLEGRNVRPSFFFAPKTDIPVYLDSSNKHYAGKLAAALEAWKAVYYGQDSNEEPQCQICSYDLAEEKCRPLWSDEGRRNT